MRDRRWVLLAAGLYVALYAVLLHVSAHAAPFALYVSALAAFIGVVVLLRRADASDRWLVGVVVGVAVVLQIVAWTQGPTGSDDVYRYVWDARVQFAGIDPYAHPPSSPALRDLRDQLLFPGGRCPHPFPGGCTLINRPTVRTIYPPAAQLGFDAVRLVSFGGHGGVRPFQIVGGLGVLAVTLMLLRRRRDGDPVWPVAIWAWSPLVVLEYGNNAHLDWLAVVLSLCALSAAARGHSARTGVLVALATLVKLYPALLVPSALRRRPIVVVLAGVATGVLLYLPHVISQGAAVLGYLPGYLHEEGYQSGARLLLLGAVLPHPFDIVVGGVVLVAVAIAVILRSDPDAPERSAVVLVGVTFLVTTPTYGWYAGLLLALCVLARRFEWLPVAFAPGVVYLVREEFTRWSVPASSIYLGAALATACALLRHQRCSAIRLPSRSKNVASR